MQTLKQSASAYEENYKAFVSAASRFNNNFIYKYPVQYHAEIRVEIPERSYVECHVQHPTIHHCNRHLRNQREPNNNNKRFRGYEHHYTYMATTVDPNMDASGDDDESVHPSRAPVQTPGTIKKKSLRRWRNNCMRRTGNCNCMRRTGNCTQFYGK
jgi:hypothetical protein